MERVLAVGICILIFGIMHMDAAASGKASKEQGPITGAQSFNLSSEERARLERAANEGDGNAAHRLAQYYGLAVNNSEKERTWLYRAAELGNASAQYHLAYILIYDEANRSFSEAEQWLAKAKANANAETNTALYRMIGDLEGTLKEMKQGK